MTLTWSGSLVRRFAAVFLASAACACIVSCGGGTDIAPSQPTIEGNGVASVQLGTLDFGSSTQLDAGVASVLSVPATAVNELVNVRADGYVLLQHGSLASPIVTLTGPGGTPVYCQGLNASCVGTPTCAVPPSTTPTIPCDFWLADATVGLLQVSPSGSIPAAPATLEADYSYSDRLLTVSLGITFPSGQFVNVTIFNLSSTAVPPLSTSLIATSAPAAPYPVAFNAAVQTNLTRPAGSREGFSAFDAPGQNLLTLTDIDLSNEGNPCLAGNASVQMRSDADPSSEMTLDFSFSTPGC